MAGPSDQRAPEEREVPEPEKKLAGEWMERIRAALRRTDTKFKSFQKSRKLLEGKTGPDNKTVRANLHYANMAAMLPQVYAKDPEFAVQPTKAVPAEQLQAVKGFAATAEFMLHRVVVKDANLKKQAKKLIRSAYATSVGWLKASWQEAPGQDPLIANRLKDTQDNIARVELLLKQADDPKAAAEHELKLAELQQALAGLQTPQEVKVARGIALDFVMSEDVIILDPEIRAVTDYTRARALAHRVWMSPDKYQQTFGYKCKKGKQYSEQPDGQLNETKDQDKGANLLCVWEIWDQGSNRVFHVCDGEEGFCREPSSPDWTGERWYPFFLVAFNETDGALYPLSDVELTDKLVAEYNQTRDDFVNDREHCLPIKVVRKGGSLTPDDVKNLQNAHGGDTVLVEGNGNNPLTNDMWMGQLGKLDSQNYDTAGSRYDMERILGGADSTTGSITKAKTATEAEILSQGLRSRSGERQDVIEDMLNELGPFALEVMLRKFTEAEVKRLAGPEAIWPAVTDIETIFNQITAEVRGGSTGKPDRLQEQDRWTKLLPIINEAVSKISELRAQGQEALAQAVIELTRETLRRFDERIDIEQFLPKQPDGEDDPALVKQQNFALQRQVQELMARLQDMTNKVEKGFVSAAAQIATSPNPPLAAQTFTQLISGQMPEAPAAAGLMDSQPTAALPPEEDEIPPQSVRPPVPQP